MNREPVREASEEDVQAYERDGVVCLRNVFDAEWVERLVKAVDRTMANPGKRVREANPHDFPSCGFVAEVCRCRTRQGRIHTD